MTVLIVVLACARPAYAGGGLNYVDSSVGLHMPGMEGGSTELEFGDVDGSGTVDAADLSVLLGN